MNPKDYPFNVVRDYQKLLKELRAQISQNTDYIAITEAPLPFVILDAEAGSSFMFSILSLKQGVINGRLVTIANISYIPSSPSSERVNNEEVVVDAVVPKFYNWLLLLKEYSAIDFSEEDLIKRQYKEEFFFQFKLTDPDADHVSFKPDEQVSLFDFLQDFKETLTKDYPTYDWHEIVEEVNKLQTKLTKLPKNSILNEISGILAKINYKGIPFLKIVADVAYKEMIKKGLYEVIDFAKTFYSHNHLLPPP